MVKRRNDFDRVAGYYDRLAGLVFGESLVKAQQALCDQIPTKKTILVAGGGSGAVLAALAAPKPKKLYYLEASGKMMALARKKAPDEDAIHWIHARMEDTDLPAADCLVTQFFLDVFDRESVKQHIRRLAAHVPAGGYWLYADFLPAADVRPSQRLVLWAMLKFFRASVSLSAKAITNHLPLIEAQGFTRVAHELHVNGMVQVCLLRKGN